MDDGPNAIIKGTFVYHPDGLPDNLTYPDYHVGYYFIYDNNRRLRELRYFFSKPNEDSLKRNCTDMVTTVPGRSLLIL